MASLQIRDLPVYLEHKLKTEAKKNHRSIAQEAVVSLEKGFGIKPHTSERRLRALDELAREPISFQAKALKSPVEMIREDRKR